MIKCMTLLMITLLSSSAFAEQIRIGCKSPAVFPDGDEVVIKIDSQNLGAILLVRDEEGNKNVRLKRKESNDGENPVIPEHDFFSFVGKGLEVFVQDRVYMPGNQGTGAVIVNGTEYQCTRGSWPSY